MSPLGISVHGRGKFGPGTISPGENFDALEIPKAPSAIRPNDCNSTTRRGPDRDSKIATHCHNKKGQCLQHQLPDRQHQISHICTRNGWLRRVHRRLALLRKHNPSAAVRWNCSTKISPGEISPLFLTAREILPWRNFPSPCTGSRGAPLPHPIPPHVPRGLFVCSRTENRSPGKAAKIPRVQKIRGRWGRGVRVRCHVAPQTITAFLGRWWPNRFGVKQSTQPWPPFPAHSLCMSCTQPSPPANSHGCYPQSLCIASTTPLKPSQTASTPQSVHTAPTITHVTCGVVGDTTRGRGWGTSTEHPVPCCGRDGGCRRGRG